MTAIKQRMSFDDLEDLVLKQKKEITSLKTRMTKVEKKETPKKATPKSEPAK